VLKNPFTANNKMKRYKNKQMKQKSKTISKFLILFLITAISSCQKDLYENTGYTNLAGS
jgi:hypothetical protein